MRIYKQLALAVGIVATLPMVAAAPVAAENPRPVVTVVTAEDPQTQLMAMVLSMQAVEQGHDLQMLLCGPGGALGLQDAPAGATAPQPPRDMSPQGLMQMLMSRGVTVEVCAIYLPGLGAGPEVLLDGVGVAEPPAMAAAMLGETAMVWSF